MSNLVNLYGRFSFRAWDENIQDYWDWEEIQDDWESEGYYDSVFRQDHWVCEQCTTKLDKNKKQIYENDIVIKTDFNATGYLRTRTCVVEWHPKWLEWVLRTTYGDVYSLSDFDDEQLEIVGNIHENGDLLDE